MTRLDFGMNAQVGRRFFAHRRAGSIYEIAPKWLVLLSLALWGLVKAQSPAYTIQYTVQQGDTLSKIAQLYGVAEAAIRAENRLSENVAVGQTLILTLSDSFPYYPEPEPPKPAVQIFQRGIASWYGPRFQGRRTASGSRYNMYAYTAAHRTLPFGTMVKVTNVGNGRSVLVRITDRGPYIRGRIIDLSYSAGRVLELDGIAQVTLEIVDP